MTEDNNALCQWQKWNSQGFIPGPQETETAYQERMTFCLHLEENLKKSVETQLPFEANDSRTKEILEEAFPLTQHLYGIQPEWTPLFFGNHQLAPWHGGCAWIFQLNEQTPTAAFLQLRANFRHSSSFLRIYHRRELIAHELAHVGRMLYQEPQFEEFFAYQSSPSRWRRRFGPIVQSSKESLLFILLLGLVIMSDLALYSIGPQATSFVWGVKFLPIGLIGLALGRLTYRHYLLKCCLQNLISFLPAVQAKHLLYRLRDCEIKQFSKFSGEKIKEFIEQASSQSFRWRFLKAVYTQAT